MTEEYFLKDAESADLDYWLVIHNTTAEVQAAVEHGHALAGTKKTDRGIELHFSWEAPELSLVAHEATHAVLWAFDRYLFNMGDHDAKISLYHHPEAVAERMGSLVSLIWWGFLSPEAPNHD